MAAAVFVSVFLDLGTTNITVTAGQNITLECLSLVNDVIQLVQWTRPDLKKYVFFCRDDQVNEKYQNPLFRGRVELSDPEMKNGNVSVVLKNVTVNDSGTYECRVSAGHSRRRLVKRQEPEAISIIELTVRPEPGHTHGDTGGGDDKGGGDKGGGDKGVHPGWMAAACVVGVIVVPGLILLVIRLRKKNSHQPARTDDDTQNVKTLQTKGNM
ncbi:V-type immunoglobulin domain-containing suppressor of T-cell activation-like [Lycodopsis pacificus]